MTEALKACRNCAGTEWVCENHPDHPWAGLTGEEIEDECNRCRDEIAEHESWLEAVASWEAAGKPCEEPKP
jgi:hypothetical protein